MIPRIVVLLMYSALLFYPFFAEAQQKAKYNRQANSIVCDNVRFQFLTPSLGRVEYSPSGTFVDAPTAVVMKRKWPEAKVTVREKGGVLTARTAMVTLQYIISPGKLTRENLRLRWNDPNGEHSWSPGDSDNANLGGITYSLDGARKGRLQTTNQGLLSKNGYFILDDSHTPVWDSVAAWIRPRREQDGQDFYWCVYGDNYPHALQEYARLCGSIPMIPRYVLGTWITDLNYEYLENSEVVRAYKYTDDSVRSLVTKFRTYGIPLDILVLDFGWHRLGWKGSYDWSPVFPDPKGFLDWARTSGVKISLNDHPGYAKESTLSDDDSHAATIRSLLGLSNPHVATFTQDISQGWKFRTDSSDSGLSLHWEATTFDDRSWTTLNAGTAWEEQGYEGYDGVAWYRKTILVPSTPRVDSLFLVFSGVDDEYDLFLDGKKVAHYGSQGNSVWNSVTYTNIQSRIRQGSAVQIALRVKDWGGGGGVGVASLSDVPPGQGIRFNLALKNHADAFMNVLHNPLIDLGVDLWWVDGGMGSCEMEGLNSQMWSNRVFYDYTEQHTNKRSFIYSRYGGWGNHRYPSFFTGDTYAQWEVLAYQVLYTAQGGNVLMPYITHDIGGFIGKDISFDLYARWVQFGVFSPLVRLHSAYENPQAGNVRMPWTYGQEGIDLVRHFFRLRYQLIPYIYTYSRIASDSALPIMRPLYLEYPKLEQAYAHPSEYFFGKEILVAPILDSTGQREVYLPPGEWFADFTDSIYTGPRVLREKHGLHTLPVFVRSGSIVPMQHPREYSDQGPLDTLLLDVYGTGSAHFNLYEDDGVSLEYRRGEYAWTRISGWPKAGRGYLLEINPTHGRFAGQVSERTYEMRFHGFPQPKSVSVNGVKLGTGGYQSSHWSYNSGRSVLVVQVDRQSISRKARVVLGW